MSEDWFDKTYRSDETPPAELDARILKTARRATRRWAGSLIAGGVFTIIVALILAAVLTNIELDVPPAERPAASEAGPHPPAEGDCERSLSLVGPLGGPGRQDRVEVCVAAGLLRAELTWDGDPSCPSRFSVAASPDTPVRLDGGDMVIGSARYRCANGVWSRI
ncbi:MAG: hypothetical protein OXP28_09605 [Gammaproteobacteria bacterium]|nr:hypothetical protein [Gammaproteobacteria bacterium]MDE0225379.1 hypothetical protein [Gammaproteobacteria bacterium]MDE0450311.1 hypothetical protein [Gammaproteobacteria bacterium]